MFENIKAATDQLKEMLGIKGQATPKTGFTPYRYESLDQPDTKPILPPTGPSIETAKAVPLADEQRRKNAAIGLTKNRG
jgi:hypothetical protein